MKSTRKLYNYVLDCIEGLKNEIDAGHCSYANLEELEQLMQTRDELFEALVNEENFLC